MVINFTNFPESESEQAVLMQQIEDTLNQLCVVSEPLVVRKTTRPTQTDWETAWLAAGNSLPIPVETELQWYNTDLNELMGVYGTIPDLETNLSQGTSYNLYGAAGSTLMPNAMLYKNPAWSPVADEIAFENNNSIYYSKLDGIPILIAAAEGTEMTPHWNDTGTQLTYSSSEDVAGPSYQIYKINKNGTGKVRLTNNAFSDTSPHWRGSKIAFVSTRTTAGIYIMNDDGTSQTFVVADGLQPQISPDGTKIVYHKVVSGERQVFVVDVNGANDTQLTFDTTGLSGNWYPTWSPDGQYIYYSSSSNQEFNKVIASIYRMDADGSNNTLISNIPTIELPTDLESWYNQMFVGRYAWSGYGDGFYHATPTVSWDGERLAYNNLAVGTMLLQSLRQDQSTGKVYQLNHWTNPTGDFALVYENTFPSATNVVLIDLTEINKREYDHLYIVMSLNGTAAVVNGQIDIVFNGDSTAANYVTTYNFAQGGSITYGEHTARSGISFRIKGSSTATTYKTQLEMWIIDYKATNSLKQIIGSTTWLQDATASTNRRFYEDTVGIWNSVNAISQMRITAETALGNLEADSRIHIYGVPGKGKVR